MFVTYINKYCRAVPSSPLSNKFLSITLTQRGFFVRSFRSSAAIMMSSRSVEMEYWRDYFRGESSDIFDIIDGAIMVAASDHPQEFMLRRCAIAERLFSRRRRCLPVYMDSNEFEKAGARKESKVNNSCCAGDEDHGNGEMNMDNHVISSYSYEEAEALTEEIEQESQYVQEVFRIKDILLNSKEWSDATLFGSLRRLQLMYLTVDLLKATEIGKAVNPLRKHRSEDISRLARTLINDWKAMVDEWVKGGTPISEGTPVSINPYVNEEEEEGLPSPPMDEGALFTIQIVPLELSQFFDGMDDDGNPLQSREFIENREDDRRPCLKNSQNIAKRKSKALKEANIVAKHCKSQQEKNNDTVVTVDSGPGRPPKSTMQQKGNIGSNTMLRKPQVNQPDKFKCLDDAAVQVKLEATKRKLQERYQQAEDAKRQRTVQVIELHDLPKPLVKLGNHKKQRIHGRR